MTSLDERSILAICHNHIGYEFAISGASRDGRQKLLLAGSTKGSQGLLVTISSMLFGMVIDRGAL